MDTILVTGTTNIINLVGCGLKINLSSKQLKGRHNVITVRLESTRVY